MSLKLLIADDEYFIRRRIQKIIPWEKLNLTFAGEAENGQQVIEHLEKEPADLLLLDIKMPQMNGIETAKYIKENFPCVHIIILSGYNDFEYARTAIRYGVKDYLLKPVSAEELERALSECIRFIRSEHQTRHTLEHYEHFHLCSLLANIRDGLIPYSELCSQYPEFSKFTHTTYCSIYVSEQSHDAALKLAEHLRTHDFTCEYMQESESVYILQIFFSTEEEVGHIGSCFTEFISGQDRYSFLYIENYFPVTADWKPYYTRTLHLLTERYFSPESNICLRYSHPKCADFFDELQKIRKQLILILNSQNETSLTEYIDSLFLSIGQKKSSDYLTLVIHEIFVVYHIYFHIPENLAEPITEFTASILDTEYSLPNLKSEVLFYGLQCLQKTETIPSDIALCHRIMDYIGENYTDSGLSVSQIAATFQMHPSYLGSVFKKVQKSSILQYISDIRIHAAQQLLKEGTMKISDVAEATGYSDVYYFSKKFKKHCGCSPKEYAATVLTGKNNSH